VRGVFHFRNVLKTGGGEASKWDKATELKKMGEFFHPASTAANGGKDTAEGDSEVSE